MPQRVVPRLSDLSSEEIADVFQSVQTVSRVIEKEFGGESMTVACQVCFRFFRLEARCEEVNRMWMGGGCSP